MPQPAQSSNTSEPWLLSDPIDHSGPSAVAPSNTSEPWLLSDPIDHSGPSAVAPPKSLIPSGATLSAPSQTNSLGKMENWLEGLSSDIKHGTGETLPGRLLQRAGAKGTEYGTSPAVAAFMSSPVQGPIRAAIGETQAGQGKLWQGAKNIGGGALDTLQIPGTFMGGPVAAKSLETVADMLPSAARAGRNLENISNQLRNVRVNTAAPLTIAEKTAALAEPVRDTLPGVMEGYREAARNGLDFPLARHFQSRAGAQTVMQRMSQPRYISGALKQFAKALAEENMNAANAHGVGEAYQKYLNEYRNAKLLETAAKIIGGAGALYGAKQILPHPLVNIGKQIIP
jgi:hypothetical protein